MEPYNKKKFNQTPLAAYKKENVMYCKNIACQKLELRISPLSS